MKGLLIKDTYMIKDGLLIPAIMMVVLGVVLSRLGSIWLLPTIAAAMMAMQGALTLSMDKSSGWRKFAATLPVTAARYAASKYALYFLLAVAGILLGAAISAAVAIWKGDFSAEALAVSCCMAVTMSLLPGSIGIPCLFALSEEKGMAATVVSFIASAGIYAGLVELFGRMGVFVGDPLAANGVIAAASLAAFLFSCIACPKLIKSREL